MPLISFITPVYNEENYLLYILKNIELNQDKDFEWIFVDDQSTDKSYKIIEKYSSRLDKIKLYRTEKKGKLNALNLAYKKSSGKFIKLVGGDDDIDFKIVDITKEYINFSNFAYIHNATIIDKNNKIITNFHPPYKVLNSNYGDYLENNISIASWCWTFSRDLGNKIFPIIDLYYEDLIISYVIKKFGKIKFLDENLYFYRQHENQTFGGIFSSSFEIQKFRALRTLKSLTKISKLNIFNLHERKKIQSSKLYHFAIYKNFAFNKVLFLNISIYKKIKIFIGKYFKYIFKYILILKFYVDKFFLFYFAKKDAKLFQKKISKNNFKIVNNKKIIFVKSKISYPTNDGFLLQYLDLVNNLNVNQKSIFYFLVFEKFDKLELIRNYKFLEKISILNNFKFNFPYLILKILFLTILHVTYIKKSKFIADLENQLDGNTKILFSDIVFYPLIIFVSKIRKNSIISITDFQTLRLLKLFFTTKNLIKKPYYLIGSLHCLIVEFLLSKLANHVHVYSSKERDIMNLVFFSKKIISINNFHFNKFNIFSKDIKNKLFNKKKKILINGNLNLPEIYNGFVKLNDKYFYKLKDYEFHINGSFEKQLKLKILETFPNMKINEKWMEKADYYRYLNSFDIIFLPDIIEFGSSNRVLDSMSSRALVVGFQSAFTDFEVRNYNEVIIIKNSNDLFKASLLNDKNRNHIINNANNFIKEKINNELILKEWNYYLNK